MADISEDESRNLCTLYWWLQGFFSGSDKGSDCPFPYSYILALRDVVVRHGGEVEDDPGTESLLQEGSFDYDDNGNCQEGDDHV